MTDLSRNAPLRFRRDTDMKPEKWVLDNSAAQTVYRGAPMIIDASEDTVYPRIFTSSVTLASSDIFVGIANEYVAVAMSDTETDNEIELICGDSEVGFLSSVFTDADVGDTVYFDDSGTLTGTSAANCDIGKLVRVDNGYAYVRLTAPQIQSHV